MTKLEKMDYDYAGAGYNPPYEEVLWGEMKYFVYYFAGFIGYMVSLSTIKLLTINAFVSITELFEWSNYFYISYKSGFEVCK